MRQSSLKQAGASGGAAGSRGGERRMYQGEPEAVESVAEAY